MTELSRKVHAICEAWMGTPWRAGQCVRGAGVDCVRFAASVWDEIAGLLPDQGAALKLPRLAQDSGLHGMAWGAAAKALLVLRSVHPLRPVAPSAGSVEVWPGDILEARIGDASGPGHVLIAGPAAHLTYHAAIGSGVIARGLPPAEALFHVWRMRALSPA